MSHKLNKQSLKNGLQGVSWKKAEQRSVNNFANVRFQK